VSKKTYQERLLNAGLPDTESFWGDAKVLASADRVRAYTLHLQGKAIAYLYSPATDGVLYYQFLGYDPSHAGLSPGTVLQYLAFERLFAEHRFALFDFESGEGQHKRQFATDSRLCADVYSFRFSPRALAYTGLHVALTTMTKGAIRMADRLGLREHSRRLTRQTG
jgi:CelD/BcsL family acetyltransferase involved in cellulose biosynthesis